MTTYKGECSERCKDWKGDCGHEVIGFFCGCRMNRHIRECPNFVPQDEIDRLNDKIVDLQKQVSILRTMKGRNVRM